MTLLARREHSRQELVRKLCRRFGPRRGLARDESFAPGADETSQVTAVTAAIETEVSCLTSEGLQSDARLSEVFIRAGIGKGQGPLKIHAGLRSKGVAASDIAQAFADAAVNWRALARGVALKKFGPFADSTLPAQQHESDETDPLLLKTRPWKERMRMVRFLQQRGFTCEHIF